MRKFIILVFSLFFIYGLTCMAEATNYYVRTDGGSWTQCTGLADAAYDGSGTGEACAWSHPAYALPKDGGSPFGAGDTLYIGAGTYQIGPGIQAQTDTASGCVATNPRQTCGMARIPAGTAGNLTKVYGAGWESCSDISDIQVKIEATSRLDDVLEIGDYSDVRCMEFTDDTACGPSVGSYEAAAPADQRTCDWDCGDGSCKGVVNGLGMDDINNANLKDLFVHGVYAGIYAPYAGDNTFENVRIVGNQHAGFTNEVYGSEKGPDVNEYVVGTWILNKVKVLFNGCGEVYPRANTDVFDSSNYHHCCTQDQGCYGDGWGNDGGDNATWVVTDSDLSYNTSDGWDGLYSSSCADCDFTFTRSRSEGNAGQTLKLNSRRNVLIENSVISGNCAYFDGQDFASEHTYVNWESGCNDPSVNGTWTGVDCQKAFNDCRAALTIAINSATGGSVKLYGNTIYSEFDVFNGSTGGAGVLWDIQNNIFHGADEFQSPGDKPVLWWCSGSGCNNTRSYGGNNIFNVKNNECPSDSNCDDPQFNDATDMTSATPGHDYDFTISAGSPARGLADETVDQTPVDNNNFSRGASWDSGAFEYDTLGASDPCDSDCTQCSSPASCAASAVGTCDYWNSTSSCQATTETCSDWYEECLTEPTCTAAGNYWYNAQCNQSPESCDSTCSSCTTSAQCSGSAARCSYIDSTCRDLSLVSTSGSAPNWTFTGEDYKITSSGGDNWTGMVFPNSSTTDGMLGSRMFVRMLSGGPYSVPGSSPSALDINTSVVSQYSDSGSLVGSGTTYGEYNYWATFFRDRVVTRVEARETVDSGNASIRMSLDADLRASAGGTTLLYNDEYRYKESGGSWATDAVDGTEPSGGNLLIPAAVQIRLDVGATDGVWVQVSTDLTNTNFTTATLEEETNYDDISLYITPPVVGTWYENTVLNLFYTGNAYQDSDVDEYLEDWATPATLSADTGTINTSATGDDDTDGFNERYGWYEITCSAAGVAKIDVPNDGIIRKTPVFKFSSAILDDYDVKINGTTLTEGVDYIKTSESDEANLATDVRIIQLLADYATGITDLEIVAAATCASDPDYCLDQTTCEAVPWFWYNGDCFSTAEATTADKAVFTGGCGLSGNATLK